MIRLGKTLKMSNNTSATGNVSLGANTHANSTVVHKIDDHWTGKVFMKYRSDELEAKDKVETGFELNYKL